MPHDYDDARADPVRDGCIWCKHDAPDGIPLDTGEVLCHNCAGDLREFKRDRFVDLVVAQSVDPTVRATLLNGWQEIRDIVADIHVDDPTLKRLPSRTSNAYEHTTGDSDGCE